jgi:hypothetical protein
VTEPSWKNYRWVLFGVTASMGYGLWGFFDRFSASLDPVLSNIILYSTTLLGSLLILGKYRRKPTTNAILSGVFGGMINILVLYSLLSQMLILVYPFVSFGTVFFMIFYHLRFKPRYLRSQKLFIYSGVVAAVFGLVLCGFGVSGGIAQVVKTYSFNSLSIFIGVAISVFTGFWIFFAYLTICVDRFHPRAAATWIFLGSFASAIIILLFRASALGTAVSSADFLFPIMGGISMLTGEIATYYAFRNVDVSTNIEQLIVVILANGELIPIMLFSYLVLHEASIEGFVGASFVLIGLIILNKARQESET